MKPPYDRIMARTVITADCWDCDLGIDTNGYPNVRESPLPGQRYGRQRKASIIVYQHVNGPIPDGMVVRHTCHNTRCIRPSHLVAGTQKQNMQDMLKAGRQRWRGGDHRERTGHEYERQAAHGCAECRRQADRRRYAESRDKYSDKNRRAYMKRKGYIG